MKLSAPGVPSQVKDIADGGCLLLSAFSTPYVCFVVRFDDEHRFVLNPGHVAQDGTALPALYSIDRHLQGQTCIFYPEARLRPSMAPAHIGKSYYKQGGLSRIMFLAEDACIVQAALDQHRYFDFDLLSGQQQNRPVSSFHYTTSWAVDVPDGDGRHTELVRFEA